LATVRILRSTTAGNTPSSLVSGQIAINEGDGKLFYRNTAGAVTALPTGSPLARYATTAGFPATGQEGVLYLSVDTSKIFRWESTVYVEVGAIATSASASDLLGGTLPDARLSANVPLLPGMMLAWGQSGAFIETIFRPQLAFSGLTLTSGAIAFSFFTPLFSRTVSQIAMNCGSTAASGLTLARMGLYTFDESTATLVAQTASDTTLFATTRTQYARSFSTATGGFPSSYTLQAGVRYGVGVICVGTTMPLIWGATPPFEVLTLTPRLSAVRTGQSDLGTVSSLGTSSSILYARLS
jgi:hypothetical protein